LVVAVVKRRQQFVWWGKGTELRLFEVPGVVKWAPVLRHSVHESFDIGARATVWG